SDRVARRVDEGTYRCELVHDRRGALSRESIVRSGLFVASEVQELGTSTRKPASTSKEVTTVLSLATAIEADWLQALFPADIHQSIRVSFDSVARRVLAEDIVQFRDLTIAAKRIEPPPEDSAARVLAEEVVAGRLALAGWDHAVEQWILRLN